MKRDTAFGHYDYEVWNELIWAIIAAVCAYLLQALGTADWTDWGTIWRSVGVGLVRAVLGAVLAFLSHKRRHPGNDIPPGGSEFPERFAHTDSSPAAPRRWGHD